MRRTILRSSWAILRFSKFEDWIQHIYLESALNKLQNVIYTWYFTWSFGHFSAGLGFKQSLFFKWKLKQKALRIWIFNFKENFKVWNLIASSFKKLSFSKLPKVSSSITITPIKKNGSNLKKIKKNIYFFLSYLI